MELGGTRSQVPDSLSRSSPVDVKLGRTAIVWLGF